MNPMKREEGELARMRRAFASLSQPVPAPEACPQPETIWGAVRGELPPAQARTVVEHMAACPSCAEDWRLAVALQRPETASKVIHASERFTMGQRLRNWGLAAAAVLALAVVGVQMLPDPGGQPAYRGDGATIQSLVDGGESLPRQQFLLQWSALETPGATYDVEVSTEDLRVVASGDDLRDARFLVPAHALAGLPPGARLLWKVDAELPQGGHVTSTTFMTTVQ